MSKKLIYNCRKTLVLISLLVFPSILFSQFRQIYFDNDASNTVEKTQFLNRSTGYVAFSKFIGFTQDSGRTINKIFLDQEKINFNGYTPDVFPGYKIDGIHVFTQQSFLVYGGYVSGSFILQTTDGGTSFKMIYYHDQRASDDQTGFLQMKFFADNLTGFALEHKTIIKTVNGGVTWTQVFRSENVEYSDFHFFNSLDGHVLNDGLLQKTSDGGVNWTTIDLQGRYINHMSFINIDKGYVVGEGALLFTNNGGVSWKQINDPEFQVSGKISFVDVQHGYVYGSGNYNVYYTQDSGKLWEPLPRDNNFSYLNYGHNYLQLYDANQIWAGGNYGFIELTTNAGGNPKPVSRFKIDTAGIDISNTVSLRNFSSSGAKYSWYVNSVFLSNSFNASYLTTRMSIDTIKLIVERNQYSDTSVKIIDTRPVQMPCTAGFTWKADSSDVSFVSAYKTSFTKHIWNFGDGTYDSSSVNPVHRYAKVGTYKVLHTIKNTVYDCTQTDSLVVQIIRTKACLSLKFKFEPDSFYTNMVKFETEYDLTTESDLYAMGEVYWNWGEGGGLEKGYSAQYHEYARNGNYQVAVTTTNIHTGCTSTSPIMIVPVKMDTICNADFDIRLEKDFFGYYYPDLPKVVFNSKPLDKAENKRHIYTANGKVMSDSKEGNIVYDFYNKVSLWDRFDWDVYPYHCGSETYEIGFDSINKVLKHIVIDSVAGWRDTVTKLFTVPRIVNVFLKIIPYPGFPAYVKMIPYKPGKDGTEEPYASRWVIDDGFAFGDYYHTDTVNYLFTTPGVHKVSIASSGCNYNRREVYYAYYTVPPLPDCPIVPPAFSISKVQGEMSLYQFKDSTVVPNTSLENKFVWYFGDGDSSLAQSPVHKYLKQGTFTVKLIYRGKNGCTKEVAKTITVEASCKAVPKFGITRDVLYPSRINFVNNTVQVTDTAKYTWYFGNGDSSNLKSPLYAYTNAGTYKVSLKVIDNYLCELVHDTLITITGKDICNLNAAFSHEEKEGIFLFSDNSTPVAVIQKRIWNFGDGTADSLKIKPEHQFTSGGKYKVCLTIIRDQVCNVTVCDTIVYNKEGAGLISARPNPTEGTTFLQIESAHNQKATIRITNNLGLQVGEVLAELKVGYNLIKIEASNLRPGIYTVLVIAEKQEFVTRIIRL